MDFKEFLVLLSDNNITSENIANGNVDWDADNFPQGISKIAEDEGKIPKDVMKDIDGIQGYEDEISKTYHVKDHDFYFRIDGISDSYGYDEWKSMPYQVFPHKKEVFVYTKEDQEPEQEQPNTIKRLSFKEIFAFIQQNEISNSDIGYDDVIWDDKGLGEVVMIDKFGGEGQGDHAHKVFWFKDHNVYMKIDGFYSSGNGTDWDDDPYEVKPQQKKITVYE
jgi:hypothetical protein